MGILDKVFGKNKKKDENEIPQVILTHVFISYSTRDRDIAENICNFLESNNVKCWMAPRDVKPGTNYSEEILKNIEEANLLMFISSNDAYQSIYIKNELKTASNNNIPIIAFKIDGFLPNDEWMYILSNARWIDGYPDYTHHYKELMEALREEFNSLGLHRVIDMSSFKENKPLKDVVYSQDSVSLRKPFKAYSGIKPYIFISYAHKDAELVFREIKKFHDKGYPIWYDQGLTAGQEWDEEIEEALLKASLLVVFITKTSMSRNNVVDEIKLALEEKIDIVPIYLEETELAKGLKLRLSQKHAIFKYNSYEEDYLDECFKAFENAGIRCDGDELL